MNGEATSEECASTSKDVMHNLVQDRDITMGALTLCRGRSKRKRNFAFGCLIRPWTHITVVHPYHPLTANPNLVESFEAFTLEETHESCRPDRYNIISFRDSTQFANADTDTELSLTAVDKLSILDCLHLLPQFRRSLFPPVMQNNGISHLGLGIEL